MSKTTKEYYEELAYSNIIKKVPTAFKKYLNQEDKFIEKYICEGDIVLEVGCGYGRSLPLLGKHASSVIGIDFSHRNIEQAKTSLKKCSNIKAELMNATNLSFDDASFDKVVCLGHTFGNFENAEEKILREMYRVLKPKGEIYISVLNQNAKRDHIQFYKNNNLTIIENTPKYIRLREGLYSRRFDIKEMKDLIHQSHIRQFKISRFTDVTYQIFIKK